MNKPDRDAWRERINGAIGTSPILALAAYLGETYRHRDCMPIEEHRLAIEQWIEAVKFCQQFYTSSGF